MDIKKIEYQPINGWEKGEMIEALSLIEKPNKFLYFGDTKGELHVIGAFLLHKARSSPWVSRLVSRVRDHNNTSIEVLDQLLPVKQVMPLPMHAMIALERAWEKQGSVYSARKWIEDHVKQE